MYRFSYFSRLTSSVSEPRQFLHDLWNLATKMTNDDKTERLFDMIASKKLSDIPKAIDE